MKIDRVINIITNAQVSVQKKTFLELLISWSLLYAVTTEPDMMMRENTRAILYTLPYPNSFIAKNRLMKHAKKVDISKYTKEDLDRFIKMYEDGFIRLTEKIEPKSVMRLDKDLSKSIHKMELVTEILKNLPGLDCGICGSPTCRAFAEDIVKGENKKAVCMIKTMNGFKSKNL